MCKHWKSKKKTAEQRKEKCTLYVIYITNVIK